MRRDRLDEATAVVGVGARQRHEILHRRVRDQPSILDVLLDRLRERAHQAQTPRHPAHTAIEASRQRVERQAVLLMQRAQQPALLEGALGRVGVQQVPKDQRLTLRHLPRDCHDRIALQPAQTADPFVAVHDDVPRARRHDHNRHLLACVSQGGQEPSLPSRLAHTQPLVAQIQLMKFELHRGVSVAPAVWTPPIDQIQRRTRPPTDDAVLC